MPASRGLFVQTMIDGLTRWKSYMYVVEIKVAVFFFGEKPLYNWLQEGIVMR